EYPYGLWILEYGYNPNELVLNGHIIALQGLYYYWEITKDPYAKELFDNGTTSIAKALPDFEKDGWSLYSNIHGRAMRRYHELHIQLLEWLYEKTENEIFKEYAERWKSSL
ncbi:D-glucuronyl C5-epimerase, partial [Thermococci archaeon]